MTYVGQSLQELSDFTIHVQGISSVLSYISLEGSIGSGKSTVLDFIRAFLEEYRLDATDPSHVDEDDPKKDYFLLVDEPLDIWNAAIHDVGDQKMSMLDIFYSNIEEMKFPFQCYTFSTRLGRLRECLRKIVPTNFPRRIHIISERSLRGDKVFMTANLESSTDDTTNPKLHIYETFHQIVCGELMKKHDVIIHIPTQSSECGKRIKTRGRMEERNIPDAYLMALERGNEKMIASFTGYVYEMNDFKNHLETEERKQSVYSLMKHLQERVSLPNQ